MAKVAFIGLGVMGYPMAGHIAKNGHDITVFNRTIEKAKKWVEEYEGQLADTPCKAVKNADFVFTCLGNDSDLRSIVYGEDGILANMPNSGIFCDHTTASANVAREINDKASARGIGFLDGPVSGGQSGAENGKLTVMVGGKDSHFDQVKPIILNYSKAVTLMGQVGSGQLTKMANQICIAGLLQGLSEGIAFSEKANLDTKLVLEVISKGAAQSWQMENRGTTMVDGQFDFGFAVKWMRKDLNIALEESKNNGAVLPVTALVDQFYAEVIALGGGQWDTSSLIRRLLFKS